MMRDPASWVISRKDNGAVLFETFSKTVADAINRKVYSVTPILDYLVSINGKEGV